MSPEPIKDFVDRWRNRTCIVQFLAINFEIGEATSSMPKNCAIHGNWKFECTELEGNLILETTKKEEKMEMPYATKQEIKQEISLN